MFTRRKFLHVGMGAAALGLLTKYGWTLDRRKQVLCSAANALPVAETGPFALLADKSWQRFAEQHVPQIKRMLSILGVPVSAVEQIRMTRWGHAMPLHRVGLIANGTVDHLRRPIDDRIYFVNQDNWALPAVENCLLDAEIIVPQIAAAL